MHIWLFTEGMDMSSSPLFISPSSKVKPHSNSTPKLKSNSGVKRELFIQSPITTQSKDNKSKLYLVRRLSQ